MKKIFLVVLLVASFAFAQTPVATPVVPATPVATSAAITSIPNMSFGVGINYNTLAAPRITGSADLMKRVQGDDGSNYPTFATFDVIAAAVKGGHGAIQTTTTAGVDQAIYNTPKFAVLLSGSAGIATGTTVSVGAFSGGGKFWFKLPKKLFFDSATFKLSGDKNAATGVVTGYTLHFRKTL